MNKILIAAIILVFCQCNWSSNGTSKSKKVYVKLKKEERLNFPYNHVFKELRDFDFFGGTDPCTDSSFMLGVVNLTSLEEGHVIIVRRMSNYLEVNTFQLDKSSYSSRQLLPDSGLNYNGKFFRIKISSHRYQGLLTKLINTGNKIGGHIPIVYRNPDYSWNYIYQTPMNINKISLDLENNRL